MPETFGVEVGVSAANLALLAATVLWLKFKVTQFEKDMERREREIQENRLATQRNREDIVRLLTISKLGRDANGRNTNG